MNEVQPILKATGRKIRINRVRYTDFLFVGILILLATFFFVTAADGITVCDESLWQLICFRVANGDKLFVNEWTLTNQVTFFTYLPYRIFTTIAGGTEGLVLALRYLYIVIKLLFFLYIYLSLREYGLWAVFAGALYVGTDLFALKTTNYYSVCFNAVFLTGMLLFVHKRQSAFSVAAAGFFFSCSVVAEPPLAAIWIVYSILVMYFWICRKKNRSVLGQYDFILEPTTWRFLFYGICAAALVFLIACAFFFTGMDLKSILAGIRETVSVLALKTDSGISMATIRIQKIVHALSCFGIGYFAAYVFLLLLAVSLRRFVKRWEKLLFAILAGLYVLMSVRLFIQSLTVRSANGECVSHPLPISMLSVAAYVFTKNKNRRLFAFMILTFAVSGAVDAFSNNSFGALLIAGSVPAIFLLRDYWMEQRIEYQEIRAVQKRRIRSSRDLQKAGNRRRLAAKVYTCCLITVACFTFVSEVSHYAYMGQFHETERLYKSSLPLDTTIDKGVLKGIITTRDIAETYKKSIADSEIIKQTCRRGLLVVDYNTTVYLDAGVPVCMPAPHIYGNDWSVEETYWNMHPDKKPDVVYIPFFSMSYLPYNDITPKEKIAYFRQNAEIETITGQTGYIVKIVRWKS